MIDEFWEMSGWADPDALANTFAKMQGRANPSLLDGITVDYYGVATPLNQVASVSLEDARTAASALGAAHGGGNRKGHFAQRVGITPVNNGSSAYPTAPLTEENRRDLTSEQKVKVNSRVSIRNIRRDVIADIRELVKKEASEDEARRGEDRVQELTDRRIAQVDSALAAKESELMEIRGCVRLCKIYPQIQPSMSQARPIQTTYLRRGMGWPNPFPSMLSSSWMAITAGPVRAICLARQGTEQAPSVCGQLPRPARRWALST